MKELGFLSFKLIFISLLSSCVLTGLAWSAEEKSTDELSLEEPVIPAAETPAETPVEVQAEETPPEFSPEIVQRPNIKYKPTMRSKDYPTPMYFDVVGDGVELLPIELDYDLETDDGNGIRLGNLRMDTGNFYAEILPMGKLDSKLARVIPKQAVEEPVFIFRWPDYILREGTVELISRTGRVLWSMNIHEKEKKKWQEQLGVWKLAIAKTGVKREEIAKAPLFNTQLGIRDAKNAGLPFWSLNESFRLCLTKRDDVGQTRICSAWLEVLKDKKNIKISPVPLSPQPARVIVMNEPGKISATLQVPPNKPVQFFAETKAGMSFEFLAVPHKLDVMDMIEDKGGKTATLIIEGDEPLAKTTRLRQEKYSTFVEFVGWQETIGDQRKFWRSKLNLNDPFMMMTGSGGGAFKQRFVIKKLPKEEYRPYLSYRTPEGSYVDGVKLFGKKQRELTLATKQNTIEVEEETPTDFYWRFGSKVRGEMNRSYLAVGEGERSFKAYHEVYKGYPREFSLRLSGFVGAANLLTILGEASFNYWFEDILGWTNYYVSRQRWGLSTRLFRSITNIDIGGRSEPLQVANVDFKYRLNPGLWGRDETWGLMAGFQSVAYGEDSLVQGSPTKAGFNASMLGVGVFWARSLPKLFDDVANLFPFMNYPKWVDMEFIYYAQSMKSDYKLRGAGGNEPGAGNYQLNFHGQVMWSPRFFGEAGFGIKQYDFVREYQDSVLSRPARPNFTLTSFYGTAGIGFKF